MLDDADPNQSVHFNCLTCHIKVIHHCDGQNFSLASACHLKEISLDDLITPLDYGDVIHMSFQGYKMIFISYPVNSYHGQCY